MIDLKGECKGGDKTKTIDKVKVKPDQGIWFEPQEVQKLWSKQSDTRLAWFMFHKVEIMHHCTMTRKIEQVGLMLQGIFKKT